MDPRFYQFGFVDRDAAARLFETALALSCEGGKGWVQISETDQRVIAVVGSKPHAIE